MSGKRIGVRFWLMLVLGISVVACSNVENQGMEPQDTVSPDSTVEPGGVLPSNPSESGVEGYVWIGPTCPVVIVGTECPDRPYETEFDITDIEGKVVAQGKSYENGFFRIFLPPGSYILVPEIPKQGMPPHTEPIPFSVDADSFTHLEVIFDSGMR